MGRDINLVDRFSAVTSLKDQQTLCEVVQKLTRQALDDGFDTEDIAAVILFMAETEVHVTADCFDRDMGSGDMDEEWEVAERLAELSAEGFERIDLGNLQIGDTLSSPDGDFGILEKITKKGNYLVRFDTDYIGTPLTKFTRRDIERYFLVDKKV